MEALDRAERLAAGISTDRATGPEKAAAWDRLMSYTGNDFDAAIQDAWGYLRVAVLAREDREDDAR